VCTSENVLMTCPGSFWKCSYGLSWFLLEMLLWLVLVPFGNALMACPGSFWKCSDELPSSYCSGLY
jgi:hypothetical protein